MKAGQCRVQISTTNATYASPIVQWDSHTQRAGRLGKCPHVRAPRWIGGGVARTIAHRGIGHCSQVAVPADTLAPPGRLK